MRTLDSLQRQEARLRAQHTELFNQEKWQQMDTVGRKLKIVLDAIHELKANADKLIADPNANENPS